MKTGIKLLILIGVIIFVVIAVFAVARIWLNVTWFNQLTYLGVFTKILFTKLWLWFSFFFLFLLFAGFNVRLAFKRGNIQGIKVQLQQQGVPLELSKTVAIIVTAIGLFIFALIMAGNGIKRWDVLLKLLHKTNFNIIDPIFHRDASFYVFVLPFYNFLRGWSLGAVILTILVVGLLYLVSGNITFTNNKITTSDQATKHLLFLISLIVIIIAWRYWLKEYYLLLSPRGLIFGATYKDVKILRPAYYIMIAISLLIVVLIYLGIKKLSFKHMFIGYGILIGAAIFITGIIPAIVQQFSVIPNQLQKELPYIKNNISFTRNGYHLENVEVQPFPVSDSLGASDFTSTMDVAKHIRIWDDRPLKTTYKQLQEFRLYYDFNQVSVDRYRFPNDFRQVMLSARELNYNQLPQAAKTWVNQKLQYTHGYGVVMSPVNEKEPEGFPIFFIKDIPPKISVPLTIDRPEIYYGQETTEYVITNTKLPEFDYPKGELNATTNYTGTGGIPVKNAWRKLLFAIRVKDWQIIFTNYLNPDSKFMIYRDIQERVPKIAPFLQYDPNTYIVVNDGKLYWIMDAFTTTNMYPYSVPSPDGYNYIRNSVKITVDAYNGDVNFYVVDPSDPLIQTYQKIFPGMFKDISEMPKGLLAHIRYPLSLFTVQASIYETYHMTDPVVFYNKEDMWETPKEIYGDTQTSMIPYYVIIRFPELENPEQYVLMFPFTPTNKNNMVAWIATFCDPERYGKMIEYQFPKEKLIFGPLQIESRIDQNTDISQLFTLWSQSGSKIIRGNLLVIPIKDSLIYVEPVYLVASNSQLPELKIVIVAYQDKLEYALSLDEALNLVFGTAKAKETAASAALRPTALPTFENISKLIEEALKDYDTATQKLREGDFANYGAIIMELRNVLEELAATSKVPEAKQTTK
jgi:uncharacterized membrane protein (UPF0182 family)